LKSVSTGLVETEGEAEGDAEADGDAEGVAEGEVDDEGDAEGEASVDGETLGAGVASVEVVGDGDGERFTPVARVGIGLGEVVGGAETQPRARIKQSGIVRVSRSLMSKASPASVLRRYTPDGLLLRVGAPKMGAGGGSSWFKVPGSRFKVNPTQP
jgi:hypothetical protein